MRSFAARQVIEQLRCGLLALDELSALTAGAARIEQALADALAAPTPHLVLVGSYGQGKSHALHYMRSWAQAQGYATSLLPLDPRQLPLHDAREVYRAALHSLCLPDAPTLLARVQRWRTAHPDAAWPASLPHRWRCLLDAATRVPAASARTNLGDDNARRLLHRALRGELATIPTLRQIFHYYDVPEYKSASLSLPGAPIMFSSLRGLSELMSEHFNYRGWIIFMDEVESIALMGKSRRLKNYELIHNWVHEAPGMLIPVFAVTPEFLHKMTSDGASRSPDLLHRHLLSEPPPEEWADLCERLTALHATAYDWEPSPALSASLMARVKQSVGRELRLRLKQLVSELDGAEQEVRGW